MIRRILAHPTSRQLVKFGLTGFLNTTIDWVIFFSFTSWIAWFDARPLVANALAFAGGFTNSFLINRRWTFRSNSPARTRQLTKFFVVAVVGLGISELIVGIVLPLSDSKLLSKSIAVVAVLGWNFLGAKFWAFKDGND